MVTFDSAMPARFRTSKRPCAGSKRRRRAGPEFPALTKANPASGISGMRIHRGMLIVGLLVAASLAALQQNPKVVATVNGENITEQQMLQAAAADLSKLDANRPQPQAAYDRARLEVLWKALTSLIDNKLLTLEAAKNHMTREELLNAEVESNVETPSPAEVEQFYEANKAQIPVPKAE